MTDGLSNTFAFGEKAHGKFSQTPDVNYSIDFQYNGAWVSGNFGDTLFTTLFPLNPFGRIGDDPSTDYFYAFDAQEDNFSIAASSFTPAAQLWLPRRLGPIHQRLDQHVAVQPRERRADECDVQLGDGFCRGRASVWRLPGLIHAGRRDRGLGPVLIDGFRSSARRSADGQLERLGPQLLHGRRFPEPLLEQGTDRVDSVVLIAVVTNECSRVGDVESESERARAADAARSTIGAGSMSRTARHGPDQCN